MINFLEEKDFASSLSYFSNPVFDRYFWYKTIIIVKINIINLSFLIFRSCVNVGTEPSKKDLKVEINPTLKFNFSYLSCSGLWANLQDLQYIWISWIQGETFFKK